MWEATKVGGNESLFLVSQEVFHLPAATLHENTSVVTAFDSIFLDYFCCWSVGWLLLFLVLGINDTTQGIYAIQLQAITK